MKTLSLILAACLMAACGRQARQLTEAEKTVARLDSASKTPQYERIPRQTTRLTGGGVVRSVGGALVAVPMDGLMTAEGKPYSGPCEVHLREATTAAEFVQYGLTTVGDEGLLESGGMMEITATDTADRPLLVNPDFGWAVSMPLHAATPFALTAENDGGGWKIFKGNRNELGEMIWGELQAEPEISPEEFSFLLMAKEFFELEETKRSKGRCDFESKKQIREGLKKNVRLTDICLRSPSYIHVPSFVLGTKKDVHLRSVLSINDKIYGSSEAVFGCAIQSRRESLKRGNKTKEDCITLHEADYFGSTEEVEICDVTEPYEKLAAWYKKTLGRKGVQDSLKKHEQNTAQQQRLQFTISQLGWYNVDRYTKQEQFAARFTVQGLDSALKPYLHLSLLQPGVNVHTSGGFVPGGCEATGVRGHAGIIVAWVDGVSLGSLAFTAEHTEGRESLGVLKLEAVSETRIDELIRRLIAEGKFAPA